MYTENVNELELAARLLNILKQQTEPIRMVDLITKAELMHIKKAAEEALSYLVWRRLAHITVDFKLVYVNQPTGD